MMMYIYFLCRDGAYLFEKSYVNMIKTDGGMLYVLYNGGFSSLLLRDLNAKINGRLIFSFCEFNEYQMKKLRKKIK